MHRSTPKMSSALAGALAASANRHPRTISIPLAQAAVFGHPEHRWRCRESSSSRWAADATVALPFEPPGERSRRSQWWGPFAFVLVHTARTGRRRGNTPRNLSGARTSWVGTRGVAP